MMSLLSRSTDVRLLFIAVCWGACVAQLQAGPPKPMDYAATREQRTSEYRPTSPKTSVDAHPMEPVLKYARAEQDYLRQAVRDFTCRLIKRERIDGFLQDTQFIDMRLREEVLQQGRVVEPLCIFLQFAGPKKIAGRRVLYIEGQNNGKMLVRNGGKHFDYVVVEIDPEGESAKEETLVPITKSGFAAVLSQMIEVLNRHVEVDPTGANTEVQWIPGAKINKRLCTVIRVLHPTKQSGLEFHVANVFVDSELHVPVRVDFSTWPTRPNQAPPLLAEYTYTDLQLNVNLPDSDFAPKQIRGKR